MTQKTNKKPFLYGYQRKDVYKKFNWCILNGEVGSGKSLTALFYQCLLPATFLSLLHTVILKWLLAFKKAQILPSLQVYAKTKCIMNTITLTGHMKPQPIIIKYHLSA